MKYIIEITEIFQKQFEIEADNENAARLIAKENYNNAEDGYVLQPEDFKEITFERLYNLGGDNYTIEQLRQGYREITGLDNDKEMSDEEIYNYMVEVFEKE